MLRLSINVVINHHPLKLAKMTTAPEAIDTEKLLDEMITQISTQIGSIIQLLTLISLNIAIKAASKHQSRIQ